MPGGDKTGPEGKGPMTGRKQKGKLFRQGKVVQGQGQGNDQRRRRTQRRCILGNR